jgi:hypothetical protein
MGEGRGEGEAAGTPVEKTLHRLKAAADPGHLYLAASHRHRGDDRARIAEAAALAHQRSEAFIGKLLG